jgi:hypothetical protein
LTPFEIDKELDEIFDACLDRLAGGETVEECLDNYPEHRERLKTLLDAAQTALFSATCVTPGPGAREKGKARLRKQLEAGAGAGNRRDWRTLWLPARIPRPVAVPMAAVLLLTVAVLGTGSIAAVAAADSVPGDSLYWVKRTKENAMLSFSRSDTGKAQAHAELAGVRAEEIRHLIEQGRLAEAENHLGAVRDHLRASAEHAGVVVTMNPTEMPSTRISFERSAELGNLVVTLERGGELFRIEPITVDGTVPEDRQQHIDRIRWEFELAYRALVAALYPDTPSG